MQSNISESEIHAINNLTFRHLPTILFKSAYAIEVNYAYYENYDRLKRKDTMFDF